jgi:radical SAM superfamily enzyme YgiQ (UPF0313 family)
MSKNQKILLLNLPSAPRQRLWRDTAGGFGTAIPTCPEYKRKGETSLHPFLPYAFSILLKAGYDVKSMDCQRAIKSQREILKEVREENPDIIFSIISLPSMDNDVQMLNKIKETLPNTFVVAVGTVCNVMKQEVLKKSKIDMLLHNNYPYVSHILDLTRSIQRHEKLANIKNISYKQNTEVVSTPESAEPPIDEWPSPCYDSLELSGYQTMKDTDGGAHPYIPIIESVGCPYDCIYCPYPLGFGRRIMFRSIKKIVDEMEQLLSVHNINAFQLRGQTFAFSKKRGFEICEEIIRRKLHIFWWCEARVNEVSREFLDKMKKAGCVLIQYGVETGDPGTLKTAKPGVTLNTTRNAFALTKQAGILAHAHIILGWPDDDFEKIERTRRFILELEPDVVNLNFLTPYPGTKIYEIAKHDSLLLTNNWSNYTSHIVIMRTKHLNAEELYAAKNKIMRDYSKQKLIRLLKDTIRFMRKPRVYLNEAKDLAEGILLPQDKSS